MVPHDFPLCEGWGLGWSPGSHRAGPKSEGFNQTCLSDRHWCACIRLVLLQRYQEIALIHEAMSRYLNIGNNASMCTLSKLPPKDATDLFYLFFLVIQRVGNLYTYTSFPRKRNHITTTTPQLPCSTYHIMNIFLK